MIKECLRLYFIMGSMNTYPADPLDVLEQALQGGITCFQLREKGTKALQGKEKYTFAEKCKGLCQRYDVPFIVNDDVQLAIDIDADGVHIGQDDEQAVLVRQKLGSKKILGISVHNLQEAFYAQEAGADYIGMGPVYGTLSKEDAKAPAGTPMIAQVVRQYPNLPIVGIGGLTADNFPPVLKAGAAGISLISAIASANDPYSQAKHLKERIDEVVLRKEQANEYS